MRKGIDSSNQEIDFDVVFLLSTLMLLLVGTVMVYSASFFVSKENWGEGTALTLRRMWHLIIGVAIMLGVMHIDYRKLLNRTLIYGLLTAGIISLVLCFVPGIGMSAGHARRWVHLIFFNYQASELTKIALILYMASFLARKAKDIDDFSTGVLPILLVCGIAALLVLVEPDFGTAAIIGSWAIITLFVAGMRWKHLGIILSAGIPAAAILMVIEPYRKARLTAFINPWEDMQGIGYQIIQSLVAFSKGGLLGTGLGEGSQKLFFLPAPHTDFIFSVLGEEIGFLGVAGVIALFAIWIWRGLAIAKATNDAFGFYLAICCVTLVGLQAVINMGVALSFFPTTGIALPFFSYGGTTLITTMIASGLVLSVSKGARL
jgi:cell division protein FtsW